MIQAKSNYFLRYVGNEPILTRTIDGKATINPGETFEVTASHHKAMLKAYRSIFKDAEPVSSDEVAKPEIAIEKPKEEEGQKSIPIEELRKQYQIKF